MQKDCYKAASSFGQIALSPQLVPMVRTRRVASQHYVPSVDAQQTVPIHAEPQRTLGLRVVRKLRAMPTCILLYARVRLGSPDPRQFGSPVHFFLDH